MTTKKVTKTVKAISLKDALEAKPFSLTPAECTPFIHVLQPVVVEADDEGKLKGFALSDRKGKSQCSWLKHLQIFHAKIGPARKPAGSVKATATTEAAPKKKPVSVKAKSTKKAAA